MLLPIIYLISVWVTLGKPRSGNPKAYTESGFQGRLTKVQLWNRALDVTGEIQKQVRDCRTEPVLYRGLILTWAGYEDIAGGVERIVPSQCGQRICPPGYTGPKCQELEVDKVGFYMCILNLKCNTIIMQLALKIIFWWMRRDLYYYFFFNRYLQK